MAAVASNHLPPLPSANQKDQAEDAEKFGRDLLEIESKYASTVYSVRIRLCELFQDFDPMRSGLMTEARFLRCIAASLERGHGNHLTKTELQTLLKAYGVPGTNMIRWRDFVNKIDKVFEAPASFFGSNESEGQNVRLPFRRPLSPRSENKLKKVLKKLKAYASYHGADVKSWFHDFDKTGKGFINYNQFHRGLPTNLLSKEESDLLLFRYGDPNTSTVNFHRIHTDVIRKPPKVDVPSVPVRSKQNFDSFERAPIGTEEVLHHHHGAKSAPLANAVEEAICQFVYKNRIKMIEFFKDYDKHNCGHITNNQFLASLKLARLPIENTEIASLMAKYRHSEGRSNYRAFCKNIEQIFTRDDLESCPLEEVTPPPRDWLVQESNNLTEEEEVYCEKVIQKLQRTMKERRLLLDPFFKDFDKTLGNMGRVTRSHFSRLLYWTGLMVSQDDLHILFKKFEDKTDGRIKYMNFIRRIDSETYILYNKSQKVDTEVEQKTHIDRVNPYRRPAYGFQELISNIQTYAMIWRIKVNDLFKDFDKLRSYVITRSEFERGLYQIGYHFTQDEVELICSHFQDQTHKHMCRWKDFCTLINSGSDFPDLAFESQEKDSKISPFSDNSLPLTPEEEEILERTMKRIISELKFRKPAIKSFFRDCDRINSAYGHVTKSQLRQCLAFMETAVTEEEFAVICKKWAKITPDLVKQKELNYINDRGISICYIHFLKQIEKAMVENEKDFKPLLKKVPKPSNDFETTDHHSEYEKLMMKIKTKAKTERIRVIDFMSDFDHLRHGKISKHEFCRAVKVLFTDVTEADLEILSNNYAGPDGNVRYIKFSDDVESVFTKKGLEQSPTDNPEVFDVYSNGWETDTFINTLEPEDQKVLDSIVRRLHKRVQERRIDALSYMEDYDFVKEGTITTNQFRSVLNQMNLGVTDKEFMVLIKFFAANHSMTRINYRRLALYQG